MESNESKKVVALKKLIEKYLTPRSKSPSDSNHLMAQFKTENHFDYHLKITSLVSVAMLALEADEGTKSFSVEDKEVSVSNVLEIVLQLMNCDTAEFIDRVVEVIGIDS